MGITNFTVDRNSNTISWYYNGNLVSITREHLDNALYYPNVKLIAALFGVDPHTTLVGFSENGNLRFEVGPPEGFSFSYLTKHIRSDVAVVCGAKEKVDGYYDWHFFVDPINGTLTRGPRAY